jgi:hypothetical protein
MGASPESIIRSVYVINTGVIDFRIAASRRPEFIHQLRVAHRSVVMADGVRELRRLLLAAPQRDCHPAWQAPGIALVELDILLDRDLLHQH